jgi:hypothetical protein
MLKPCNMVINIKNYKNQWRISSDWYSIKLGTSRYQINTKQWNGTGSANHPLHGCVQQRHRCTHLALATLMLSSDLRSTTPIIGKPSVHESWRLSEWYNREISGHRIWSRCVNPRTIQRHLFNQVQEEDCKTQLVHSFF